MPEGQRYFHHAIWFVDCDTEITFHIVSRSCGFSCSNIDVIQNQNINDMPSFLSTATTFSEGTRLKIGRCKQILSSGYRFFQNLAIFHFGPMKLKFCRGGIFDC